MNKEEYASQIIQAYSICYKDYYTFKDNVVNQAEKFIINNLKLLQIIPPPHTQRGNEFQKYLKDLVVLNIGTGRETYVFLNLGVKKVYHFDISNKSVEALTKVKKENNFNVETRQLDICDEIDLDLKEKVDLVYMHGVLPALRCPGIAFKNIFPYLSANAKMYQSTYRSGSFVFFVVDFLRRFIAFNDREIVDRLYKEKYSPNSQIVLQTESTGDVNKEKFHSLYSCIYDDFFAPVVGLHDMSDLNKYFRECGFSVLPGSNQDFRKYDHQDSGIEFQSPLIYLQKGDSEQNMIESFPPFIDQMKNIDYKEDYINKSIQMMNEFLLKAKNMEDEKRINYALDIYAFAQQEIIDVEDVALFRHQTIQEQLRKVLY